MLYTDGSNQLMEKNIEVSLLLDFYGDLLKPSSRQMIDLYYNDDLSLGEIAEDIGITRQGVRDSIKRCEKQLFGFEEKLGLLSRFRTLEGGLDEIASLAKRAGEKTGDPEIRRLCAQIEAKACELKE